MPRQAIVSSSPSRSALVGFLLGSFATAVVSIVASKLRQEQKRLSSTKNNPSSSPSRPIRGGLPKDLREEQLSRHTLYFGPKGMEKLTSASVAVVGLGGVGSHTAHMLARAGVSYLRIIDFDQVTLSSLNRHACASLKDVGTPKATCLQSFLRQICPDPNYLEVDAVVEMYTKENGPRLLEGRDWNIVIDAIDDVPTKAALLAQCIQQGIRVISCMGAGGKSDVTRLHISDLKTASRDPLASKLRQHLKRLLPNHETDYMGDMEQLAVVYSSEKTVVKLADFTEEQKENGVHQYGAVDNMRIRVLPVLGTMPAIMGQTCAAMALCELGEKHFSPVTGERVGRNVRHRLHQRLKRRETLIREKVEAVSADEQRGETKDSTLDNKGRVINGTWVGPVQIDGDDVEYLMEVWRNRCAVTGDRLGSVLELVRWDLTRPSTCNNIVLMAASALNKFEREGQSSVPEAVRQKIEARLNSCRLDAYAY